MTREGAIKAIQDFIGWFKEDSLIRKALEMAIQALEQNESAEEWYKLFVEKLDEQEPCEDAISREELLKAIDTWDKFGYTETGCFVREPKGDYVPYIHYDDVIKCIKGMPPVTPQKYGEMRICPSCGLDVHSDFDYCPRCGAKMQESEDKE